METHCSTLAGKIPWRGAWWWGRVKSMGLQSQTRRNTKESVMKKIYITIRQIPIIHLTQMLSQGSWEQGGEPQSQETCGFLR